MIGKLYIAFSYAFFVLVAGAQLPNKVDFADEASCCCSAKSACCSTAEEPADCCVDTSPEVPKLIQASPTPLAIKVFSIGHAFNFHLSVSFLGEYLRVLPQAFHPPNPKTKIHIRFHKLIFYA